VFVICGDLAATGLSSRQALLSRTGSWTPLWPAL